MYDIFTAFSSKAKIQILRTLYFQPEAIPLRHISYLSNLPLYSVQNALKPLLKNKLIIKKKRNHYVLFQINKNNPLYDLLKKFFIDETTFQIEQEAKNFHQRAVHVLAFAHETHEFFNRQLIRKPHELN